jgi:hypothetical protein
MVVLTNSPPAQTALRLEQRNSFVLGLNVELSDETVADLTGHTLTFAMAEPEYKGSTVVVTKTLDLLDAVHGVAQLSLQGSDLELEPGQYPYTITILTPEAFSAVVVKGHAQVVSNPTVPPGGPYVGTALSAVTTLLLSADRNRLTVSVGHMLQPQLEVNAVNPLPYWATPTVQIEPGYPVQRMTFGIPVPADDGASGPTLANLPPGVMLGIYWDGTNWKLGDTIVLARPTPRTDIVIHLIDPIGSAVQPAWVLPGDLFDQI